MAKYFILIDHTDYVAKNQLADALQGQFLKFNKTITSDLKKTISRFEEISRIAHNLHRRCKQIPFDTFNHFNKTFDQETSDSEIRKDENFWCGHWGVAIAKFYKIREEAQDV